MITDTKNPQQNIGKLNSTAYYKDNTLWSVGIFSRDVRMVRHLQISQYDTLHQQNEGYKLYDQLMKNHQKVQKKHFNKLQHPFVMKTLTKVGMDRRYINIIKAIYNKPIANIILNWENLKAFGLRSGMRQRCQLSPLLFNIVSKILLKANR